MNLNHSYYNVKKGSIKGKIAIPSSKSHANRILILAALSSKDITINNLPPSSDVTVMLKSFKQIGLELVFFGDSVCIKGSFPNCEFNKNTPLLLKTGDGGTTNRFLLPLLALGEREYIIEPYGHMKVRPMDTLFRTLKILGVSVKRNSEMWASIKGPMKNDLENIDIDASVSSQFASGFHLALSQRRTEVRPKGMDGSEAYYRLTCDLTFKFSEIAETNQIYDIPIDFSSLSYPVALSLFDCGLSITNCLSVDRLQPDSSFLEIIKNMGGDYHFSKGYLSIDGPKRIIAQNIDCREFPDLVPTLAFCFSYASGETILRNLRSLRVKECDRIKEIMLILELFKIECFLDDKDDLHIIGKPLADLTLIENVVVTPPEDHRMVMLSYLFLRMNSGGDLFNYNSVNKSFSNFYEIMEG